MPAAWSGHCPERDPVAPFKHVLISGSRMLNEKTNKPVIAVIDDDESVLRSVARLLKASGFESVLFRSAEAFLADPRHPRFDCLILDLQLGGMTGIDLKDRLALAGLNIPIVLTTARDPGELDRLALQSSVVTVMRKSDSGATLLATLKRLIHRYRHPASGCHEGGNARC